MLGQIQPEILAQMIAHRYPNLTWEQLARHVGGESMKKAGQAKKDGTRQKRGKSLLGKK